MNKPSLALALLAASLLAVPAQARVVFTGYGDFRFNAYTPFRITGDAPALAGLGITDTSQHHSRGFSFDSVGLFAATSIKEDLDFKVDFNYRNIGQNVGQIRFQYAYLEGRAGDSFGYRAGKITLPFGYYNENRFYPFQRPEINSPFFQSAILGLPIASLGASARESVRAGGVRWDFDEYAVNGYGAQSTSPNVFRSPTIPGGTAISNNLGATDNNANVAFGGRITAAELGGGDNQVGVSYYGGAWDPSGSKYFQMWNSHWHSAFSRVDVLAEYLHLDVAGDDGFAGSLNDTHWKTDGAFIEASVRGLSAFGVPVTPHAGAEGYRSEGHNGKGSQEKLQAYRAGLQLKPHEQIALKAEYIYLFYALPFRGAGEVRLWAHEALMALVVTF